MNLKIISLFPLDLSRSPETIEIQSKTSVRSSVRMSISQWSSVEWTFPLYICLFFSHLSPHALSLQSFPPSLSGRYRWNMLIVKLPGRWRGAETERKVAREKRGNTPTQVTVMKCCGGWMDSYHHVNVQPWSDSAEVVGARHSHLVTGLM